MIPAELIRRTRDRLPLEAAEIGEWVDAITDGFASDAQVASWAMAVFLNGLTHEETVALTRAMRSSGTVLEWNGVVDGPVVDKHSTGGVGDKVSLILAPIAAACGLYVPMLSGRGLGHTGGTLDKLESIPGYCTQPDEERLKRTVAEVGCAIIGQTEALAPADKRLYAIRDATGTVESIPLIVASILSKKLAAGLDGLVLDVKYGSGAFMVERQRAQQLADRLVEVASGSGVRTSALLSHMDQVLGRTAGNAIEVAESIHVLCNRGADPELRDLTVELAAQMLLVGRSVETITEGRSAASKALDNGSAADHFGRMVASLGGPLDLLDHPDRYLARPPIEEPVYPEEGGFVEAIDVREIGLVLIELGGGRLREDDSLDHSVGLSEIAKIGDRCDRDRPLAIVGARTQSEADYAKKRLQTIFSLSEDPVAAQPTFEAPGVEGLR